MTATATTIPIEAVEAAGSAIADAFGLGADLTPSKVWPVEEGDTVLGAEVGGDATLMLLLAVNDDVAGRLASDESRLRSGFQLALDAITAETGLTLELGEIGTADQRPSATIEIQDHGQLCALFGLVETASGDELDDELDDAADVVGGPGANGAAAFQPAAFAQDGGALGTPSTGPLSLLQDVEMDVTVELGRTTMPIRDLLSLQPGMVVEIDRTAGSPIDVLVNGRLIAVGEVVVIDEEFGIRITDIVSNGSPIDG